MEQFAIEPNLNLYNAFLTCAGKSGDYKSCLESLQEIQNKGLTPNVITYNSVLDGCVNTGNHELMERIWTTLIESVQPTILS